MVEETIEEVPREKGLYFRVAFEFNDSNLTDPAIENMLYACGPKVCDS